VLEKQKSAGPDRRLNTFVSGERLPLFGGETLLVNGQAVSVASSGGFGHTVGKTIVFGYLPIELESESDFELEAFGERYRLERVEGPLYDPQNLRLKS
jgi:4-methylaminobutanoate oxidase (formaldehyde-forming)